MVRRVIGIRRMKMAIRIIRKSYLLFRAECPHCYAFLEYDIGDADREDIQCPCCSYYFSHRVYGNAVRESEEVE